MKRVKLTREEQKIEAQLDEYVAVGPEEYQRIADAISARKKDAVLNIRINSQDLKQLKDKAKKLGIKYQTFITEILHKVANVQ